jgi:hypothetical protein
MHTQAPKIPILLAEFKEPKHVQCAQNLNQSSKEITKGILKSYHEIQEQFNECSASEFGVEDFNKIHNNKRHAKQCYFGNLPIRNL